MSERTVTDLLMEMAPELDEVQRDVLLHHLEQAATDLSYVAWQCARAHRASGGEPVAALRELLEKVDDLRRAYVKLGGHVHPAARGAYPEDVRLAILGCKETP